MSMKSLYSKQSGKKKKEDKDRANNPCSTNYPGPEALSESETKAFTNFLT